MSATKESVYALMGRHRQLVEEIKFLEDMSSGKAPKTLVTPSLECLQDGQFIEVSGTLIATIARDRLPALRTEAERLSAKLDRIDAILREDSK